MPYTQLNHHIDIYILGKSIERVPQVAKTYIVCNIYSHYALSEGLIVCIYIVNDMFVMF